MKSTAPKKKSFTVILCGCLILIILGLFFIVQSLKNPRIKLLLSVIYFSEETLKNPSYMLYDIDIMEFIHEYLNSDTLIKGDAQLYDIEGLGFSVSASVEGVRSLPQAESSLNSTLSLLGRDVGDLMLYAKEEDVYVIVPMLDDFSYAFPTGTDLFLRMPDLTSDLNQKWFHENAKNIIQFSREIDVVETGNTIKTANGRVSNELYITIPEGSGLFIWDLLGMEYPSYDVNVSLYLTDKNRFRRMEIDLKDVLPGAMLIIDEEHAHTGSFYYELPDNEAVALTMVRDGEHKNKISFLVSYTTNQAVAYSVEGDLYWSELEKYSSIKCKNVTVKKGNKTLATAYFSGELTPLTESPEIFEKAPYHFNTLTKRDWKEIRDDTDSFMQEIKDILVEQQKNVQ